MNKTTKKIDAKTFLADIKAGMPDALIVKKYKLSAAGLKNFLTELHESEISLNFGALNVL